MKKVVHAKKWIRVLARIVAEKGEAGHLVGVQTPELKFFFEERPADVGRIVELPGAVVVEDLSEDARVSVEEVLVEHRVVVGQGLGEPGKARGGDLLQGRLVRLVPDAAHVEHHPVLGVQVHGSRPTLRRRCPRAPESAGSRPDAHHACRETRNSGQ